MLEKSGLNRALLRLLPPSLLPRQLRRRPLHPAHLLNPRLRRHRRHPRPPNRHRRLLQLALRRAFN
jgi:hypothetical protein